MLARLLLTAAVSMIAACALAQAAQADECPGANDVPTSADAASAAADTIVCLVNAERTSRGLKPLQPDQDLAQAGRRHASDMVRRDYFSHVTPSGKTVGDRVRDAGYGHPGDGWKVGEDLGWGTGSRATPQGMLNAWLASPPHRRIMLEAGYREIGVGGAQGTPLDHPTPLPGATYALEIGRYPHWLTHTRRVRMSA